MFSNLGVICAGRASGDGGAADLLGREEVSWDPLEGQSPADQLADPAFQIPRLYQSLCARRNAQQEIERIFEVIE